MRKDKISPGDPGIASLGFDVVPVFVDGDEHIRASAANRAGPIRIGDDDLPAEEATVFLNGHLLVLPFALTIDKKREYAKGNAHSTDLRLSTILTFLAKKEV